jgi:hypothetical protein
VKRALFVLGIVAVAVFYHRARSQPWPRKLTGRDAGVLRFNKKMAFDGVNLVTAWFESGGCELMNNEGKELKRFPGDFCVFVPGWGMLLADERGVSLVDGKMSTVWEKPYRFHHDIGMSADKKEIFFLIYRADAKVFPGVTVQTDAIIGLDRAGKEIFRWDSMSELSEIVRALKPPRLFYHFKLSKDVNDDSGNFEMGHLNAVSVIPPGFEKNGRAFKAGNLLVSFLTYGALAVIDRETRKIVWSYQDREKYLVTHSPRLMADGRIVYFKNFARNDNEPKSEIEIIDPKTNHVDWSYSPPQEAAFSVRFGQVEPLPNGNLLVTDDACQIGYGCEVMPGDLFRHASMGGRAYEITMDKKIVWEWANPQFDKNGERKETYRVQRLPESELQDFHGLIFN